MRPFNVFIDNYKIATQGFNIWGKALIIVVLSFILVAVILALWGVFGSMIS